MKHPTSADTRFGPLAAGNGRYVFRLWAPSTDSVALSVADAAPIAMQPQPDGWFVLEASGHPGAAYYFVLPDGLKVPDPASRAQADDVHGASLLVDQTAYMWQTAAWRNRPWHEAVIYEVHPGTMGGFEGIRAHLKDIAAIGVTAIELMPVADFPGARNWGYDGVLPFAPDRTYGSPDQLKALVDAAHAEGLMVFMDVVYNHFGPDGAYLHTYAKSFFDSDVHTPWGAAIDFKRQEVCDFFIENALMWVNEYRVDGLRFDAVHAIAPAAFLPQMAAAIRAGANHEVHLVLEHEGNKASLLTGKASRLFDAQWADDWHHCLHVLLTGESEGYYEDFQNPAEQLARAMAEGFVYQGEMSPHLRAARGEASAELPPTSFVICLQNHDQIGNRAMGERLAQLADRDALNAATALLLLSPSIPLIFMGDERGSRSPFLFFTDHNAELADLVREGRRKEFQHFAAFKDVKRREQIPDPNAESTFAASLLQPENEDPTVKDLYRELLKLRKQHVTPGIPKCRSAGARALGQTAVEGSWLLGNGNTLTLVSNFGAAPVPFQQYAGQLIFASNGAPAHGMIPGYATLAFLDSGA